MCTRGINHFLVCAPKGAFVFYMHAGMVPKLPRLVCVDCGGCCKREQNSMSRAVASSIFRRFRKLESKRRVHAQLNSQVK
jgi:hypothetical protein